MRWPSAVTRERDADPAASMRLLQEVLDRPLDPGYQSAATRRRAEGLPSSTGQRSLLMLATALVVGFVLSVAAVTLRTPDPQNAEARAELVERIEATNALGDSYAERVEVLRAEIADLEELALQGTPDDRSEEIRDAGTLVGATAVTGPGVVVVLDDAPSETGQSGAGERVLARDLQAVVNGLWSAGAEAVDVNDRRLTSTSSIRFAGEAIIVDFRGLTRPYTVRAIGEPESLGREVSEGVTGEYLAELSREYGIIVDTTVTDEITVPAAERLTTRVAVPAPEDSSTEENP
ncbi:DUF881 domain-containing protein [Ornithinimicrobium sediminis]|uniref:DUF881 domain-containing protein n=1 Tax=Ornithinimicrobium sediminis TaxID=2904603 RepID=UPI001E47030B|nr:DUF881 domain-containing protein [Ornithinimicrobium sediminis]